MKKMYQIWTVFSALLFVSVSVQAAQKIKLKPNSALTTNLKKKKAASQKVSGAVAGQAIYDGFLSYFSPLFIQTSDVDTSAYVSKGDIYFSIDQRGQYKVIYYPNSTIGYMDAVSGDLMYCVDGFNPPSSSTTFYGIVDCEKVGNLSDLYLRFYSNGQDVYDGRYVYHENGVVLTDLLLESFDKLYRVYFKDGRVFNDTAGSFYKSLYWYSGRKMIYEYSYDVAYYPDGSIAASGSSSSLTLRYPNNYRSINSSSFDLDNLYFANGYTMRSANTLGSTLYYGDSRTLKSIDANDIGTIYYQSGNKLKRDYVPAYGQLFWDYSGESERSSPIDYTWSSSYYHQQVKLRAEKEEDIIGITQDFDLAINNYAIVFYYEKRERALNPPAPRNLRTTATSYYSATVNWDSIVPIGFTQFFKFATGGASLSCEGGSNIGNVNSRVLSGLQPDTQYSVAVCVRDERGRYSESTKLTFRTKQIVYPPAPVNLTALLLKRTKAYIDWTSGGGTTVSYKYAYGPANANLSCSNATSSNVSAVNLTSLRPGVAYKIIACGVNIDGFVGPAATLTFVTRTEAFTPAPTLFKSENPYGDRIPFSWKPAIGVSSYIMVVQTATQRSLDCRGPAAVNIGPGTPYMSNSLRLRFVTGLTNNESIRVALCSVDEDGISNPVYASGRTLPLDEKPPKVLDDKLDSATTSSLSISWRSGGANTDGFVVAVADASAVLFPLCTDSSAVFTRSTNYTISGLSPFRNYLISVCSKSRAGAIGTRAFIRGKTLSLPVATPSNLQVRTLLGDGFAFTWNRPTTPVSYKMIVQTDTQPSLSCGNSAAIDLGSAQELADGTKFARVTGLRNNQTVTVALCAYTNSGISSSAKLTVTTLPADATPPKVVSARILAQTSSALTVAWQSGGGSTYNYLVNISDQTYPACSDGVLRGSTTHTFNNLQSGRKYYVSICAKSKGARISGRSFLSTTLP